MGLFGQDKNLAAQLADAQAEIANLKEQHAAAVAFGEEKLARIAELEKSVASAQAESAAKDEAVAKAQVAAAAKDETIADLEKKLANPPEAYRHASEGKEKAVAEGGEAQASYWEQYYAINDPKERTLFWRKHRGDLEKEQRAAQHAAH